MVLYPANFGLSRPFCSRVRLRHVTDRRTDRHHPSFYNAPPYRGPGHNNHLLCFRVWKSDLVTINRIEPILDRIATDRSIVICPMIDAINDKTLEFSRQGGVAVGGFTWSLHFTWRAVPDREQSRRKSETDPARWLFMSVFMDVHLFSSRFMQGWQFVWLLVIKIFFHEN